MQYRFGSPAGPELVFPTSREHPKQHFESGNLTFAGGGGAFLKFKNGAYTYTVFSGIGRGWEKDGVVVHRAGKQISYLECSDVEQSEIGLELFNNAEIPTDPNEGDFEIP